MTKKEVKRILDAELTKELPTSFISSDPVQIPISYSLLQDKEITGFWSAMLAWGLRKTIINKSKELFKLMDDAPFQFITQHQEKDLKRFEHFKHRTFQYTDTLYFIDFFKRYYTNNESLESAFLIDRHFEAKASLTAFHNAFFNHENAPQRTRKHIATPARKSACKRINLFLKWMVRTDEKSGDMGVWKQIKPSQLMLPLDVHVMRSVQYLNIADSPKVDWKIVEKTTNFLSLLDPDDPIKYDYALFNLSKNR